MNIRFVSFEDINKNKWNGSVHYALNSNVYGYYWYLKSVIKEWDALIEDDYISVMPLPRYEWSSFQLNLLCGLGPYSVNVLNDKRITAFFEQWQKYCSDFSYVFNQSITSEKNHSPALPLIFENYYCVDLNIPYEDIYASYSEEFNQILSRNDLTNYEFGSQEKPENILSETDLSKVNKHILYRLFYNSIQRGTGWHARVINKKTKKNTSAFFITDGGNIYLIYATQGDLVSTLLLIDAFLQNNAGKPRILKFGCDKKLAEIIGAETMKIMHYKAGLSGLSRKIHKIGRTLFQHVLFIKKSLIST